MLNIQSRISLLFNGLLLALQGRFRAFGIGPLSGTFAAAIILVIIVAGGVIIYFIIFFAPGPTTTYP